MGLLYLFFFTYYERVFVASGIQHAMRMCHIIMWPASLYDISHIISQTARFSKKKVIEHKMGVMISSTNFV